MTPATELSLPKFAGTLFVVAYPFAVFFLLDKLGPGVLGAVLVAILLLRHPKILIKNSWLVIPALGISLLFLGLDVASSEVLLRLYPVAVNAVLLAVFAYSLYTPPTMIERLASAAGTVMTPVIKRYTRKVTLVWCAFFFLNGVMALLIGLAGSMRVWLLYNGIVAYVLIGLLLAGEYIVRIWYIRRQEASGDIASADQSSAE